MESENTNVCERDKKLTHDGLHVRNRHCLVCSKRRPEEKQIVEIIREKKEREVYWRSRVGVVVRHLWAGL